MIIRSLFDSLVNRLNEYRYELTVTLSIPPTSQTLVNNCLDEFKNIIIPYVQRTCCQNDVKQDDINRIQIFIDKMLTIIQHIHFYWDDNNKKEKRSRSSFVRIMKLFFFFLRRIYKIDSLRYTIFYVKILLYK